MKKTKYEVCINGSGIRFYVNSRTKEKCWDTDFGSASFDNRSAAEEKARLWGLPDFTIRSYEVEVTNLAEMAFD